MSIFNRLRFINQHIIINKQRNAVNTWYQIGNYINFDVRLNVSSNEAEKYIERKNFLQQMSITGRFQSTGRNIIINKQRNIAWAGQTLLWSRPPRSGQNLKHNN